MENVAIDQRRNLNAMIVAYCLLCFFLFGNWDEVAQDSLEFWDFFEFWILTAYTWIMTALVAIGRFFGLRMTSVESKLKMGKNYLKYLDSLGADNDHTGAVVASVSRGVMITVEVIFIQFMIVLVIHQLIVMISPKILAPLL